MAGRRKGMADGLAESGIAGHDYLPLVMAEKAMINTNLYHHHQIWNSKCYLLRCRTKEDDHSSELWLGRRDHNMKSQSNCKYNTDRVSV